MNRQFLTPSQPCGDDDSSASGPTTEDRDFAKAWEKHSSELFRRCLVWMGGRRGEAEEAFSRAGMNAFLHFDHVAAPRAWLLKLTHNTCMDLHRERARRSEESLDEGSGFESRAETLATPEATDPESCLLQSELEAYLERCILELPERLRELALQRLAEEPYGAIAERLGITEVNVRKRTQHFRAILRQRLEQYRSGRATMDGHAERPAAGVAATGETALGKIYAVRSVVVRLSTGVEKDAALLLFHRPMRASSSRLVGLESYIRKHQTGWKKRLELARELGQLGRFEEAIHHYRFLAGKQPCRLDVWLECASVLDLSERRAEAIEVCQEALRHVRIDAKADYLRGLLEVYRGRPAAAAEHLQKASAAAPKSSVPLVTLAETRRRVGRCGGAIAAYEAALEVEPDDPAALTLSHDLLLATGRTLEGRRRVMRAAELDGLNLSAVARWVSHRCFAGQVHGSEGRATHRLVERLRRHAGDCAETARAAALFHLSRGEASKAKRTTKDFVAAHPRHQQGWLEYARLLFSLGEYVQAARAMAAARDLRSPDGELRSEMGRIWLRAGWHAEARGFVDEVCQKRADDPIALGAAARVIAELSGGPNRALELAKRAVQLEPDWPSSWFNLGRILAAGGLDREAARAMRQGWALLPPGDGYLLSAPAALRLAEVYDRLGEPDLRQSWYRTALDHARCARPLDLGRALTWERKALQMMSASARERKS